MTTTTPAPNITDTETIVVGLGEISVSGDTRLRLACYGLGSCVAVAAYDPIAKVAGLSHVVLPETSDPLEKSSGKYANTAIPILLSLMERAGAERYRLVVKLVGGANIIRSSKPGGFIDIGERNQEAVALALNREGITIKSSDLGGNYGRSMWISVATGKVTVRINARNMLFEL